MKVLVGTADVHRCWERQKAMLAAAREAQGGWDGIQPHNWVQVDSCGSDSFRQNALLHLAAFTHKISPSPA